MIRLKRTEWYLLMGLLTLSFIPCVGGIFRLIELNHDMGILPENPRIKSSPIPVVFHLLSVVPYCLVGAFQFLPSFRKKYPKWHKVAGRILVITGIVSALSGLWMAHYYSFSDELQGDLLYIVRILVGVAMIAAILLGLTSVMKGRIAQHRAWMIRAYSLGQGAGTQVLITIPLILTIGEPIGLSRDLLMTFAWVINIFVAELIISKHVSYKRRVPYESE